MLCFFKEVHVFVDIVFEEYPRIIRNRVNPGMGLRMLGELALERNAVKVVNNFLCLNDFFFKQLFL